MTMRFTILGAGGRIGGALVAALKQDCQVWAVERAELPSFLSSRACAGHIINCIGLTGDFRSRPHDTAEAHVTLVSKLLARGHFESFLLLSSTRVYANAQSTAETSALVCCPADASDLYNLTKLAGEALCLAHRNPAVRVARLSNVVGPVPDSDTFLGQVIAEGRAHGLVRFRQSAASAKDYVPLSRVVSILPRIALGGQHRLYNVASGRNVSHEEIAARLRQGLGWTTVFSADAPTIRFPPIAITRLNDEFGVALSDPLRDLSSIAVGQEAPCSPSMKLAAA
ncbi:MAG: NAD-dependent epimerase/dehydratase family protein [Acetobacteraceae bacterium]